MTDIPYTTRKKPVRKVRAKARPGRLKGDELTSMRLRVFERDLGMCRIKKSKRCWGFAGWWDGHMHHVKHRSLGGKDELSNLLWGCPPCHAEEHVPPKPCPPKQRIEENS
jgi:5-methylcytosine-specific restriction endonuclease McrA